MLTIVMWAFGGYTQHTVIFLRYTKQDRKEAAIKSRHTQPFRLPFIS